MRARAVSAMLVLAACGGARPTAGDVEAAEATPGGASWSDAQIDEALAPRVATLAACASGRASFGLRLEIRASGHLDSIAASELDEVQNGCVRDALEHFDLPGHVEDGRTYATTVDATRATEESALAGEMRSHLDRHRATILACALQTPVTIEARWDGTGAVTFHLRGLETTDRERCVIDALAAGAPDTAGETGSIALTYE